MTRLLPVAILALTACETAGDGTFLPSAIEEMIPPGITADDLYSRPSVPEGTRCYFYQQSGIEILVECAQVGLF